MKLEDNINVYVVTEDDSNIEKRTESYPEVVQYLYWLMLKCKIPSYTPIVIITNDFYHIGADNYMSVGQIVAELHKVNYFRSAIIISDDFQARINKDKVDLEHKVGRFVRLKDYWGDIPKNYLIHTADDNYGKDLINYILNNWKSFQDHGKYYPEEEKR